MAKPKTKTKTKKTVKRPVRTLEARELVNATGGSADVAPSPQTWTSADGFCCERLRAH